MCFPALKKRKEKIFPEQKVSLVETKVNRNFEGFAREFKRLLLLFLQTFVKQLAYETVKAWLNLYIGQAISIIC